MITSVVLCLLVSKSMGQPAANESTPTFDSKEAYAARLKHMMKHTLSFTGVRDSDQNKIRPLDQPLLRWTNAYSNIQDGVFVAWIDESHRPMAVGQICLLPDSQDQYCVELQSLSDEAFELKAEFNGPWRPRNAGVEWKKTPQNKVAKSKALRLVQMRRLAEEFQCEDDFESKENPLRLLTSPLHRYSDSDCNIIDGAMFAMVHGTDPELIILVELRRNEKTKQEEYFYALAPMTSFELKVSRKGEQIWHKPPMASNLDTDIFWQRQLAESALPPKAYFLRFLGL